MNTEHSAQSVEKDAGRPLDPWGEPMPPIESLRFCGYVSPRGLPCTCRESHHKGLHFTSDGHAYPGTYVTPPATPDPIRAAIEETAADDLADYTPARQEES